MVHKHILHRNGRYVYRRRIPQEVSHLDTRREIKIALKTSDLSEAIARAKIYDDKMTAFWAGLIKSGSANGLEEKYEAAVQIAKAHGFAYMTANDVAMAPINEIIDRLNHVDSQKTAEALLGGILPPEVLLSAALESYWGLAADRNLLKSDHAKTKWENPRRRAFKNFITVVGDTPLNQINRQHILSFREWLNARILKGFSPNSANKQMRQVKDIIRTTALAKNIDIDIDILFKNTNFQEPEISRPPFEEKHVREKILPNLDGLLEDARLVTYILADTGARPSEIIRLKPEDIRLDTEIPYIWIRGELKTKTSERQIPLVGYALDAFKQRPDGFNRRWKNADSLSAIVNKYLREKDLLPTSDHSLYSLRHTFKDRLRDIEAPEEIIDELMGHKKSGPKYGRGHRLDKKLTWLQKIAYK